ncbi:hypothetical protein [Bergeyella zoohelcum]|uniref:Uncharacterized protein n=1 Tax=Bergeyella zoohelcum TaxID=1015 RepID=A0A380ZTA3_9FLAO|nr:hypothetical protein [Bergeyella zoohelcum]EKB59067.1 hypothetical protein HMPREF9700_01544 [Bergeyella zoohelcum CCUG 30536]SUV52572.1 Uncharacterised protein [Bergeyella zoohelcum]
MYYNKELAEIFAKIPFINVTEFSKLYGFDASNLNGYIRGTKKCGEKAYHRVLNALREAKKAFPE